MHRCLTALLSFLHAFGISQGTDGADDQSAQRGKLEYSAIKLLCPEDYLSFISIPSEKTAWAFPRPTLEQVKDMLRDEGITEAQIEFLFNESQHLEADQSIRVYPAATTVSSMPPVLRARLYKLLARLPGNPFHSQPIFLHGDQLENAFPKKALSGAVQRLLYPTPSGHGYFLSDIPHLMKQCGSTVEERELLSELLSASTLLVRLKTDKLTRPEIFSDYWGHGYPDKEVPPFVESLSQANSAVDVDLALLLPPTARKNLNTYPGNSEGLNGRYPDWFWTCFNFYRFVPQSVYADSIESDECFHAEFVRSVEPRQFGDILLLKSGDTEVHGCVYLADDIVYTKNGADLFSPPVFMTLQDVVAVHDLQGDIEIAHYGRRTSRRVPYVFSATIFDTN